jgi:peptidoglycan/LPS O-acetylase OafA/YrhL
MQISEFGHECAQDSHSLYPVSFATALVILGSPEWLTVAPLRDLGRISYGVYLYHWPIFQLGEQFKPDHSGHLYAIGLLAVILAVSVASYEFVEKPFLRLKDRIGVRRLRIACAAE